MYYKLIQELVDLVELYEQDDKKGQPDVTLFVQWAHKRLELSNDNNAVEPNWQGKELGRSPESVINTSLVHLYRYAKLLAKDAIAGSEFSTPDDFIYLICLVANGSLTKTALIKLNVHEKSAGMQIINRLIAHGLVEQETTETDKRNRMIHITQKGRAVLEERMDKIRAASSNVSEPLSHQEKMQLISLLSKLESFHEVKNGI